MKFIIILFLLFIGCSNNENSTDNTNNLKLKNSNNTNTNNTKLENSTDFKTYKNYNKALINSIKDNKKLFIIFSTVYCKWCHKLKNDILNSKKIQSNLMKNYITLFLDRDDKKSYPTKKYTVFGVPAIYIVTSDGEIILARKTGYYQEDALMKLLNNFK